MVCFHFYLIAGTEQKSKIQVCPEMLTVMWSENWNGCVVILAGRDSFGTCFVAAAASFSFLPPSCLPSPFLLSPSLPLLPPPFWSQTYWLVKLRTLVTPENSHEFTGYFLEKSNSPFQHPTRGNSMSFLPRNFKFKSCRLNPKHLLASKFHVF